jgi:ornithine cyclodeaminase/alanine dehydrogenase-like protein (mu-crystallin family)
MTLHVSDAEVRRVLGLEALIAAVREALIDLSARRVVQPLRSVMEIPPDLDEALLPSPLSWAACSRPS